MITGPRQALVIGGLIGFEHSGFEQLFWMLLWIHREFSIVDVSTQSKVWIPFAQRHFQEQRVTSYPWETTNFTSSEWTLREKISTTGRFLIFIPCFWELDEKSRPFSYWPTSKTWIKTHHRLSGSVSEHWRIRIRLVIAQAHLTFLSWHGGGDCNSDSFSCKREVLEKNLRLLHIHTVYHEWDCLSVKNNKTVRSLWRQKIVLNGFSRLSENCGRDWRSILDITVPVGLLGDWGWLPLSSHWWLIGWPQGQRKISRITGTTRHQSLGIKPYPQIRSWTQTHRLYPELLWKILIAPAHHLYQKVSATSLQMDFPTFSASLLLNSSSLHSRQYPCS